jgi:molybdenum cofactor biosynthesis enzyme MoaA
MNAQSLSVCVPAGCPNKCKFCVAHMHKNAYEDKIKTLEHWYENMADYRSRLEFARDNSVHNLILTGSGEPMANMDFIERFSLLNLSLKNPFKWMEIQTSGVYASLKNLEKLRYEVGIKTISLSLSSFNSDLNAEINGTPDKLKFDIPTLCKNIKDMGFNLRLSLNMTNMFALPPMDFFEACEALHADQVTLRVLYQSGQKTVENTWIQENKCPQSFVGSIFNYVKDHGKKLHKLSFGAMKYSLNEMSIVIDDDSMATQIKDDVIKYMILRPDCKLYTQWDDRGSLLF